MSLVEFTKKNKVVHEFLKKYISTKNLEDLSGCTFYHIGRYLVDGHESHRLSISLLDFGYEYSEIVRYRQDGMNGWELAERWLSEISSNGEKA